MSDRITITLEPEKRADLPPDSQRLKRCLKALLRGYSLRCVSITTTNETEPEPATNGKEEP